MNSGNRREANRTLKSKSFHKYDITIMSSFNDAWCQTNLYEILPLCTEEWNHIVYLVYAACNIYKYVTFIHLFIFSLNRLTACRSEEICLQPCKTIYCNI